MNHLAEELMEYLNEENKELIQELNKVKEENEQLKKQMNRAAEHLTILIRKNNKLNKFIEDNYSPSSLYPQIIKEVKPIKIKLSSMYGKFGNRD